MPGSPPKLCNIHQMNGFPKNDSVRIQTGSSSAKRSKMSMLLSGTPERKALMVWLFQKWVSET